MNARATNLTLFVLLLLELVSGLGSFLAGSPQGQWVFWLHSAGGLSVVVLLVWKWRIVVRSFVRRGAGLWSFAPALLGVLFLGILFSGLWWLIVGRGTLLVPVYGEMRPIVLHTILALALVPLFTLHVVLRWPARPTAAFASRRAVLRLFAVGAGGFSHFPRAGRRRPPIWPRPALHRLPRGGQLHRQQPPRHQLACRQPPAHPR